MWSCLFCHFLFGVLKLGFPDLPFTTLLTGKRTFTCVMLHMLLHVHFLCKCLSAYITHESATQFVYILVCCKTSSCMKTGKIIACLWTHRIFEQSCHYTTVRVSLIFGVIEHHHCVNQLTFNFLQ